MSRRLTWAATSVPTIRTQWCNALAATIHRHSQSLDQLPSADGTTIDSNSVQQLRDKVVDAITWVREEADALGRAPMYWVARDMVAVSLVAAKTLPSWSPAEAAPTPSGLLCRAKPAGVVPFGDPTTSTTNIAWDAVSWRTRPDGILELQLASRFSKTPDLLAGYRVRTPLRAASTICLDPQITRSKEASRSEGMHPLVSVVGAAWLLMSQPNITDTRITEPADISPPQRSGGREDADGLAREPASVSIIELRRNLTQQKSPPGSRSDRHYRGRWMVGWPNGYWRQQRYGPGGSLRKPVLIAPHTAGPKGAPLIPPNERVHLWRR